MKKTTIFVLFVAGLLVGTLGVLYAKQSPESTFEEPLFIG
jgi:hypothetical protein